MARPRVRELGRATPSLHDSSSASITAWGRAQSLCSACSGSCTAKRLAARHLDESPRRRLHVPSESTPERPAPGTAESAAGMHLGVQFTTSQHQCFPLPPTWLAGDALRQRRSNPLLPMDFDTGDLCCTDTGYGYADTDTTTRRYGIFKK